MAYTIDDSCIACGACPTECPVDAIADGDIYSIAADKCTSCGVCADACPVGAIKEA
ncbi:MAG: 4Fe-4S binding protein [Clostridiales bacterium]|nr:4Fe-4S binding protein [Clostridiales bacterium]